jgi:hypothetical protein
MDTTYAHRHLRHAEQGLASIKCSQLWGETNMRNPIRGYSLAVLAFAALLLVPSVLFAQDEESKGIDSGDYNIHQTLEFGYRDSQVGGNMNNYNTFVHLGDGARLFDYTLDMRSLDHDGLFFDNLSFSNFGYGGDPNDMSRLRIGKNKWFDFSYQFRRDKDFWNYDLLANPLNQAAATAPALPQPIANSPHALDLVRRMQDFDLTLLPESRVRFRLGYSRNVNEGPAFTTAESGALPMVLEGVRDTSNAYRAGVDFRVLPKTMISYDQSLIYNKEDTSGIDPVSIGGSNLTYPYYQIANPQNLDGTGVGTLNGTPVDAGLGWWTAPPAGLFATPCAAPVTDATTTPNATLKSNCNGMLSYSFSGRPRISIMTERFRFQTSYFPNFEMSGAAGYSSSDDSIPDFLEAVNGFITRNVSRGGTTAGPAKATRVSTNVEWSGVYRVTDKARIRDAFRWDNLRIPGTWFTNDLNLFGTSVPGLAGLQLPIAVFNATNCPADPVTDLSTNVATCPQHTSGSPADVLQETVSRFLGQDEQSNTLQFEYDLSQRVTTYIGYLYTHRKIVDKSGFLNETEIYYPGGATGTAANYYLAARGDCSNPSSPPTGTTCTLNADGSITATVPVGGDTERGVMADIHGHSLLLGVNAHPIEKLQIISDLAFGWYDSTFVRIDPRQEQSYKVHGMYKPTPWANVDGLVEIHESRDNVATVNNLEHDRMYNFTVTLIPNSRLAVDFGYSFWDVYTQSLICFPYNAGTAAGGAQTGCPQALIDLGQATPETSTLFVYGSNNHYAFGDVMWKPYKRVTATVGYSGNIARSSNAPVFNPAEPATATLLNPYQPTGTLDFNFIKPYASLAVDFYKGFSYKTEWNYFGYNDHGTPNPARLAPLPLQDFNGSNITFLFRYAF